MIPWLIDSNDTYGNVLAEPDITLSLSDTVHSSQTPVWFKHAPRELTGPAVKVAPPVRPLSPPGHSQTPPRLPCLGTAEEEEEEEEEGDKEEIRPGGQSKENVCLTRTESPLSPSRPLSSSSRSPHPTPLLCTPLCSRCLLGVKSLADNLFSKWNRCLFRFFGVCSRETSVRGVRRNAPQGWLEGREITRLVECLGTTNIIHIFP